MIILQFILVLIFFVIVQGVIYHTLAFRGLKYSCTILHNRIFEGETNELVEVIENKKLLPLLWLKVETRFSKTMLFTKNDNTRVSAGVFHRSVFSVPAFRRIKRSYRITCTKRGYYHLGSASITTGDLFGLINKTFSYTPEAGLHVFPIPVKLTELHLPSRSFMGDVVVRRYFLPDPFMPAGIRDYTPRDPQKLINWKASAKTGKLVVQKHDFTSSSKLMVFFNIDYSSESRDNSSAIKTQTMENALRVLASVLNFSISSGQQTALHTNSVSFRDGQEVTVLPAPGGTRREDLFAAVAEMRLVRTRNFYMLLREAAQVVKDTDILIMTRYKTDEMNIEIDSLRHAGNKVEIFIIPDQPTEQRFGEGGEESA